MAGVLWVLENIDRIFLFLTFLLGIAEIIVRFTPTKKDDGFIERIGTGLRLIMDFLKIPNRRKKDKECEK